MVLVCSFLSSIGEVDCQPWLHFHGTRSQLRRANPLTPCDPVIISPSLPTLPARSKLEPPSPNWTLILLSGRSCSAVPMTLSVKATLSMAQVHWSSQPMAMFPSSCPYPCLNPSVPVPGVMEGEATDSSLSLCTLLCRISYLLCLPHIVPECPCFPPLSPG